jgi:N-glycosylase/DNA lyase
VKKDSYIKVHLTDFDLYQIANSGQCFRMNEVSSGIWEVATELRLRVHQDDGKHGYIFECSSEEFQNIWFGYFDLGRDYGKIKSDIRAIGDPYLTAAVDYGHGIRVLRQDLWEIVVTFLISQQNNIPRIRGIIAKLCEPYGHRFPTPDLLASYTEDDFLSLGLGYRAKYLRNIVKAVLNGDLSLSHLRTLTSSDATGFLKRFDGIGDKVANCIVLFGLHRVDAFPIDVWIRRVINEQYGGNFDITLFPGYAGIVQQYMFFYQRNFNGNN